jgi:uncharacterized protein (DUF488 family)
MATLYSIGHSMRSTEKFVSMLQAHGVEVVVDVRRVPGSRRYPQFKLDSLADSLGEAGIGYRHEPELGGRRSPREGSPNVFWRNLSFRGYADHMGTDEFQDALDRLIGLGEQSRTAMMCSEALPWRCHRRLIADALALRGHDVQHIIGDHDAETHIVNPNVRTSDSGRPVYDQPDESDGDFPLFENGSEKETSWRRKAGNHR